MDTGRKKYTPRKEEFIGWASRKLLFFLASIGRSVDKPISQSEVYDIVVNYINENNLRHPQKKKKVMCDGNLRSLLGRKSINRNRISGFLESHFPENQQSEDESLVGSWDELETDAITVTCKRQKSDVKISKSMSLELNEMASEARKNCFASITEKNIKLVYLRRSLLEKFVWTPETIESKVVDCFIRVKSDLNCYHLPKSPFQLVQITGIGRASMSYRTGEISTDIVLKVSNVMKEIHICMVSDDDFSEEECKDLHDRMKEGHLKRPTVGELENKARSLHEDITNHWIDSEILSLKNRIERANEKGWRRELFQYIDRLELLQSPAERIKMLNELPKVIADEEIVLECSPKSFADAERANEGNEVANQMDREASVHPMGPEKETEENGVESHQKTRKKAKERIPSERDASDLTPLNLMDSEASANLMDPKGENKEDNGAVHQLKARTIELQGNQATQRKMSREREIEGNEDLPSWKIGKTGTEESISSIYSFFFGAANATNGKADERGNEGTTAVPTGSRQQHYNGQPKNGIMHLEDCELQHEKPEENKDAAQEKDIILLEEDENKGNTDATKDMEPSLLLSNANGTKETRSSIAVIDIDDDDDDDGEELPRVARMADDKVSKKDGGAEMKQPVVIVGGRKQVGIGPENCQNWHYLDPKGQVQGPFTMSALKAWKEAGYFSEDFKVWKTGQPPENGILLTDAICLKPSFW